jgi:hypothetical protein
MTGPCCAQPSATRGHGAHVLVRIVFHRGTVDAVFFFCFFRDFEEGSASLCLHSFGIASQILQSFWFHVALKMAVIPPFVWARMAQVSVELDAIGCIQINHSKHLKPEGR